MQGERAGERCMNTTDNKYCEKHLERSYLREYAHSMGKEVCGNGTRCTEIIDGDKTFCDKCMEYNRTKEAERALRRTDISTCYKCGKKDIEFSKTKRGTISRFCIECYSKLRAVEDTRQRKVSKQTPEAYYEDYKRDAARKKRTFELTLEEFRAIISKPCAYCGKIEELEYNGIDRVDNTKGYYLDNCASACKMCNLMKSDHTVTEFKNHCKTIDLYVRTKIINESRLRWAWKNECSYQTYKTKTAKRGLEFTLTEVEYNVLKLGSCYICGTIGTKECQNGIDRIDSSKGYKRSNCESCCPWCNRFKNTTSLIEFVDQCGKIASY
jgi:hypothetical protein